MRFTQNYTGEVIITPTIDQDLKNYLNDLLSTRRVMRDVEELQKAYGGKYSYNGSYGIDGEFYANIDDMYCMNHQKDNTIIDYYSKPRPQPSFNCMWIINANGNLEWNKRAKTYCSVEWLEYIIKTFLEPNGYECNGDIDVEETGKLGRTISVNCNKVLPIPF